ncbi:MAG: hypothetical protein IJX27_07495 [Clostridia bacterium]|nr:hypothetical protein [Clostridia bacterium]
MKNAILSAVAEIEKQCEHRRLCDKIVPGSAEYYAPFEKLYETDRENFCAALWEIRKDGETKSDVLLHALRLSEHFGINPETLAAELRRVYSQAIELTRSEDLWERRDGFLLVLAADELLKSFAGGEERSYFENFISLSEVVDIQTAGLYALCADLHLVKPTPKYIKDALRASGVIDGLYGTVLWQYYLEHTSVSKITRDISVLETVGFSKIPALLKELLEKFNCSGISAKKEKARFFERLCIKNKAEIAKIMAEEENTVDKYIASHNNC